MLKSRHFLLSLLLSVFFFSGYTQHITNYSIKQYSDENGLPQNSIKSIVEDQNGFIWLATEAGLVRFDGNTMFLYDKRATGTSSNRIHSIIKAKKDGQYYAENEYREIIPIRNGHALKKSLEFSKLFSVKDIRMMLTELPKKDVSLQKFIIELTANQKYSITHDQVLFTNEEQTKRINFKRKEDGSFFSLGNNLIYSDNKEIFTLFKQGTPENIKITGDLLKNNRFKKDKFKVYWNNSTDQVFLYLNKILYQLEYKEGGLSTTRILYGFDFPAKQIMTVYYKSTQKRLFLGSLTQGLLVLQHQQFNPYQLPERIANKTTYAQIPFGDNLVLFANGELLSSEGKEGHLALLNSHSNNFSIVTDQYKNIWTQKESSVYKFSPAGDHLLRKFNFPAEASCLYIDQDSIVWIATRGGIYTAPQKKNDSLPTLVTKIKDASYLKRKNEILWIGSFKGLYRYDLLKKNISAIPQLAKANIRSILIRKEEVWISTYGDGFYLYKNKRITKMPLDELKYLNHAHCLMEDKAGFFWISTNKGLFQVAIKDLIAFSENRIQKVYYTYFDKSSGFKTNEFNGGCQPCSVMLNNGFMVFPTLLGPVFFNPNTLKAELPDKPIFIDKIQVDNIEVENGDSISVGQEFERMDIWVSSPYFGHAQNLQLEYRLSGNENWTKLTENKIIFSKLQYGNYALFIRKLNGFNSDFTIRKLTIIVKPYFYHSWWFHLLLVISVFSLFYFFIKKRTQLIELENERLENLVRKRTNDLEQNILNLEESQYHLNQRTSFQEKLITVITHDVKTPLKYMTLMGKKLHEDESSSSELKDNMRALYISANSIYQSTENLLNYSKLFLTEKTSKEDYIILKHLVDEKIEIFSEIVRYRDIDIHNLISDDHVWYTKHVMLSVIVHNLLDNAIKSCRMGSITFGAKSTKEEISFWIQDTGIGMSEELVNWLNSEEKQEITEGLGFKIIKHFVANMDLNITVESKIGVGTQIKITQSIS